MKRFLHVVRDPAPRVTDQLGTAASAVPSSPPAETLAEGDWVVYEFLDGWKLAEHGAPPLPVGSIDDQQFLDLVFRADAVVTW